MTEEKFLEICKNLELNEGIIFTEVRNEKLNLTNIYIFLLRIKNGFLINELSTEDNSIFPILEKAKLVKASLTDDGEQFLEFIVNNNDELKNLKNQYDEIEIDKIFKKWKVFDKKNV